MVLCIYPNATCKLFTYSNCLCSTSLTSTSALLRGALAVSIVKDYYEYILRSKAYLFRRWFGDDLDVTKLKLIANLQMPNLRLMNGDCTFTAHACDFTPENNCSIMESTITLQSTTNCPTSVSVSIAYPFELTKICTDTSKSMNDGILYAGDILMVS